MPHSHPPEGNPKGILVFADSILRGGEPLPKLTGQGRDKTHAWVSS
jgi:hypothetical protein